MENNYSNPMLFDSTAYAFPPYHPGRKPHIKPGRAGTDGCRPYREQVWGYQGSGKASDAQALPRGAFPMGSPHQTEHFGTKVTLRKCIQTPKTSVPSKWSNLTHNNLKGKTTFKHSPVDPSNSYSSLSTTSTRGHRGRYQTRARCLVPIPGLL